MSHGADVRVLASASSDGVVKTWIMADDGTVTENGSYDSGNRLICLALYDAAIEQLDTLKPSLSKLEDDSDLSSDEDEESDDDENGKQDEEEDEWGGIEDDA